MEWLIRLALVAVLVLPGATAACGGPTRLEGDAEDLAPDQDEAASPDETDGPRDREDGRDDGHDEVSVLCGNGAPDPGEECDDGLHNSDTVRDACRTDCRRAHCGDGVVDTGEGCDDGNDVDTDACRNTCVLASCGDGTLGPGEECDDGARNSDTTPDACRTTCLRAWCGDDVVDTGEGCDDGNRIDGDGCSAHCIVEGPLCGNGIVDPGEECDNGPENSDTVPGACRTNCVRYRCGDAVVDPGEACDDGNTISGDGCEPDCSRSPTCGNGIAEPPEECDDGNTDNSDDCLSTCLRARCGDGFVHEGVEECDPAIDYDGICPAPCGSEGTLSCTPACVFECIPPPESCNGADDDCDGATDDGFACVQGASTSCVTACGTWGAGTCTVDCSLPSAAECAPPPEICNGLDDDCDTAADNGFGCPQGAVIACTTTCGSVGTGVCSASCVAPDPSTCAPPDESCNDLDDDCDTAIDEGFPCRRGTAMSCTTTCGSTGSGICTSSCEIPTAADCGAPAETCNGVDDDCVDGADNGFACVAGTTQTCSAGSCNGTQTCDAPSCTWGSCSFGAAPANDTCAGPIPDVSGGGTYVGTTCAASNDFTASCGATAASSDVIFALNLSETSDMLIDTVGSDFDAVLHVRRGAGCPGTAEVACDDNSAGGTPGQARILRNLSAGSYWVILDGAGTGSRGNFILNVTISATPPPPNDACSGAIDIRSGGVFSGSTARAADDHTYTCAPTTPGGLDVWYTFTLTGREIVYLDTVDGNTWDSVLQLRQGSCASPTSVACADDQCRSYSGGVRSQIVRVLDAGTYFVVVDGWNATSFGNFALRFQHAPCAGAVPITGNGNYDGATTGQGNDTSGACGGATAVDVLYYFGLCGARAVAATTCDRRTNFDTVLYFRSGSCDVPSELACNDNNPLCTVNPLRSTVTATLPQGLNFLAVDGFYGAEGSYRVTISGM